MHLKLTGAAPAAGPLLASTHGASQTPDRLAQKAAHLFAATYGRHTMKTSGYTHR
jgi:hypothetical protein